MWDQLLGVLRLGTLAWDLLRLGRFVYNRLRGSFRVGSLTLHFLLGSVVCDHSLAKFRWKSVARYLRFGSFRFRTFAWELSLGKLGLGTIVWQLALDNFHWELSLGSFHLGKFVWGISPGNFHFWKSASPICKHPPLKRLSKNPFKQA